MSKVKNKKLEAEYAILEAIAGWDTGHAYGASFRDVALETNLPLGTVHAICRELRDAGTITFHDQVARSLKVKEKQ